MKCIQKLMLRNIFLISNCCSFIFWLQKRFNRIKTTLFIWKKWYTRENSLKFICHSINYSSYLQTITFLLFESHDKSHIVRMKCFHCQWWLIESRGGRFIELLPTKLWNLSSSFVTGNTESLFDFKILIETFDGRDIYSLC